MQLCIYLLVNSHLIINTVYNIKRCSFMKAPFINNKVLILKNGLNLSKDIFLSLSCSRSIYSLYISDLLSVV